MTGTLYVTGTPIGNMGDISSRALDTLGLVDFIAAEDTRVTAKILAKYDIHTSLVSYHEHNKREMGETILSRLLAGESCALVTDAGMPAISDPGTELVDLCYEHGVPVASVPGPSAVVTALAMSGMDVSRFTFEGFLSVSGAARREHLEQIRDEKRTMVFYEAPHKLARTLRDLYDTLGGRRVALVKELTKIHETVERTTLDEAARRYAGIPIKGEFVLVIEGKPDEPAAQVSLPEAVALARSLMAEKNIPASEAAKLAAKQTGLKKSGIYSGLVAADED